MAFAVQDRRAPMENETWFATVMRSFGVRAPGPILLDLLSRLSGHTERVDALIGRAVEEAFAEFAQEMAEQ